MEEDEGAAPVLVPPGTYVTLNVLAVPAGLLSTVAARQAPLVVGALLPLEQREPVLRWKLQKISFQVRTGALTKAYGGE